MSFPLLHDPEILADTRSLICKVPILGWMIGYERQIGNEKRLWNQARLRGAVPESEWDGYEFNCEIRDRITKIIRKNAFYEDTTFHPEDPFELMIVLRYGDLNEADIMNDIQDEYGIVFDDPLIRRLLDGMTFYEFIKHAEKNGKVNNE